MANSYYTRTYDFAPRTKAKGEEVKAEYDNLVLGFDKLPTEAELRTGTANYAVDTGAANAYIVTLGTAPTLADGLEVAFKAANTSTGSSTLNLNGTGVKPIIYSNGTIISSGGIELGAFILVRYNGTSYVMQSQSTGFVEQLITSNGAIANGALVDDLTPQLGGNLDANGNQVQLSKGADVASATALPVLTDGNYFDVTGTATITSINATAVGAIIKLHFDGVLTLTHHATDLILPTSDDIVTEAGDEAEFVEYANGDYRCINYMRATGLSIGSTKIAETTVSSPVAAVDFTLPTTYKNINIKIIDLIAATSSKLSIQLSSDGGSTWTTSTDYGWAAWPTDTASTNLITIIPTASTDPVDANIWLLDYNSTTSDKRLQWTAARGVGATVAAYCGAGIKDDSSAIDTIRVLIASGNISSGTIIIYGED